MTELGRAQDALTKEIAEFAEQTKLLTSEAHAATCEQERAQRRLTDHRNSRGKVLGEFYAAVEDAETVEHEARIIDLGL